MPSFSFPEVLTISEGELRGLMSRFLEWKKVCYETCPAVVKAAGIVFCLIEGSPCSFLKCPRRIFQGDNGISGVMKLSSPHVEHKEVDVQ